MSYGRICLLTLYFCILLLDVAVYGARIENEDEDFDEDLDTKKSTQAPALPPCDQDKLLSYLAEMQAVTPENIINLPNKQEVDELCMSVTKSMDSFDKYSKRCEPPLEPNLYFQLIKGIRALYQKMCKDDHFKRDFQKNSKCYRELRSEYGDCFGPPDWQESTDKEYVCSSYGYLNDCYYIKTATLCGKRAAKTMSQLAQSVMDNILTVKCENVKKEPEIRDAMPDSSSTGWPVPLPLLAVVSVKTLLGAWP